MIVKIFNMDEVMGINYSEMLLPGALKQISWGFLAEHDINSVVADLWAERRSQGKEWNDREVRVERSTQRLTIVIIYMFHHVNGWSSHSCVYRLHS